MNNTYIETIQKLDKLDYKELCKAIFYLVKSYEIKEQYKLNEKQADEALEKTYDFFMESDLGSFVDERLLDKIDEFINEVLEEKEQNKSQIKRKV